MSYKVLYRKYRPQNFSELVGQQAIKESLLNAIKKNQLAHAYIFTGPRGTGKTSTAKIFAKALTCLNPQNGDSCGKCDNCQHFEENPDIIEIDAASNNGVDEIREIKNNVKLVPTMSKYKIYIVDEVHMLSINAWNAFLKTLEEPPSHVKFIFATTDIQKVPLTVLSRCQRYDFHRISDKEIKDHLEKIAKAEKLNINEEALSALIKISDGCLRDCLSYLDQLSKISSNITESMVNNVFGLLSHKDINDLINALMEKNAEKFLVSFNNLKENGVDCNNLITNMIDYVIKEASNIKLGKNTELTDFNFCHQIINDLFEVQSKMKFIDNPYNLFLITFLNYFEDKENVKNNEKNEVSEKKNISQKEKESKNISREIKSNNFDEQLKKIRVNNVFCKANKQEKKAFGELWNSFISYLNEENQYSLLGYLNNMNIQVVSDEYVLFSTEVLSDSVLFNNNLDNIEEEFKKRMRKDYKFISLNNIEWNKEKEYFIKNKNKIWEYIDEKKLQKENTEPDKLESEAKDIFGDVIEIK